MSLTKTNISLQYWINGFNIIGLIICVVTLIVELQKDADPSYKAFCDLNENFSCSKALMSKWGKGFGIVGILMGDDHRFNLRNPAFGIPFYGLMALLTLFNSVTASKISLWLAILSNINSVYMGYVMYYYIKSVCILCVALYVVNFMLLVLIYQRHSVMKKLSRKKRD